jgi:hypothetical protein
MLLERPPHSKHCSNSIDIFICYENIHFSAHIYLYSINPTAFAHFKLSSWPQRKYRRYAWVNTNWQISLCMLKKQRAIRLLDKAHHKTQFSTLNHTINKILTIIRQPSHKTKTLPPNTIFQKKIKLDHSKMKHSYESNKYHKLLQTLLASYVMRWDMQQKEKRKRWSFAAVEPHIFCCTDICPEPVRL